MDAYLIAVGCVAIGFAIGCPFGVGAAMWGMMDWDNGRRERIAKEAMQGILANPDVRREVGTSPKLLAGMATEYTDALIDQLQKKGAQG